MKDLHDKMSDETRDSATLLQTRHVPAFTRMMSAVTGTSREQLGFVPDADHRTVGLVGLTLLLVLAASAVGWWIALAIARGQAPLRHLPVVLLVGGLVYVVDRAMVRQHWVRYGRIQASARGFYVPNPHGKWLALVIHWLLRVSVSLVLSLTTAGFVELALFETDIATYRDGEARAANKPIYDAVQRDVDETAAAMRSEIDRLDAQIDALTQGPAGAVSAAQAAARQQIADLAAERTEQRTRIATLGQQIDCITRDRIAEKHGGVRCDNSLAVAGEGQRWEMAGEQLDYLRGERDRAEARIGEIDGDLARLQAQTDPVAAADQARLAELTDRRSQAQRVLSAFIAARGATVSDRVTADARFVPVLDGLVLRGEALDALASSSPWLATRIRLVFASMAILDLAAVIVLSLLPPPVALAVGEVLASETATHRIIARHERLAGAARRDAMSAREETLRCEVETDAQVDRMSTIMATRRKLRPQFDAALERALSDPPPEV